MVPRSPKASLVAIQGNDMLRWHIWDLDCHGASPLAATHAAQVGAAWTKRGDLPDAAPIQA